MLVTSTETEAFKTALNPSMTADLERLRGSLARLCVALPTPALGHGRENFALAFSGGLDSRFLAFAARQLGFTALLIHASGPHVSQEESAGARQWAAEQGFAWLELALNPLAVPELAKNDRERCYFCKHYLFSAFLQATPLPLCDGSNASDQSQYRPGLRALSELGIHSPLALAGLEKERLRALGQAMGLDNAAQRARPCLLTRFDYGVRPEAAWLLALAEAETLASRLWPHDFRLRVIAQHLEWHILEPAAGGANFDLEAAQAQLSSHLATTALAAFLPLRLRRVAQLSGYFDHKS